MLTAIVSDLHLGARASVLNTPPARDRLVAELAEADEVVLLGDLLALRDAPLAETLDAARPFLAALGEAVAGHRVVLVPGNHDHRILAAAIGDEPLEPRALQCEWVAHAGAAEPLGSIVRAFARSELVVAYPGLWVRPDVYATHGHYLDCHLTLPRLEAIAAHAMAAATGRLERSRASVADYEAIVAPIYAFAYARAQAPERELEHSQAPVAKVARRLRTHGWSRLAARNGRSGPHVRLLGGALAFGALAVANRAGVGPFSARIDPGEIGRAGVRAMGEVVARLGIDARYVVFGHVHRAGPLEADGVWATPTGTRLVNSGSWVYEPALIRDAAGRDPFWPGTVVVVDDDSPPALRTLLVEGEAGISG